VKTCRQRTVRWTCRPSISEGRTFAEEISRKGRVEGASSVSASALGGDGRGEEGKKGEVG